MGLCGSSMSSEDAAEKGTDKKVDQALKEQQAQEAKVNKLLLLGQIRHQAQLSSVESSRVGSSGTKKNTFSERG